MVGITERFVQIDYRMNGDVFGHDKAVYNDSVIDAFFVRNFRGAASRRVGCGGKGKSVRQIFVG